MHDLASEPIPAYEFNAAREQLKGNILLSLESTENRMTRLAKNEIYLGKHPAIEEALAMIDAVTPEDASRLARELFQDKYLTLQILGEPEDADFSVMDLTLG